MTRPENTCPTPQALNAIFTDGATAQEDAHVRGCALCRAELTALASLAEAGRALPTVELSPEAHRTVRAALVILAEAAAKEPKRPARPWLAVAALAALVLLGVGVGLAWWAFPGSESAPSSVSAPQPLYRATLHVVKQADYQRIGAQPDELVRLRDGIMAFDVSPLVAGERFRVVTGDAEVEVRGTKFEVHVQDDHLQHVHVFRGHVEVRPDVGEKVDLLAGEQWNTPERVEPPGEPSSSDAGQARVRLGSAFSALGSLPLRSQLRSLLRKGGDAVALAFGTGRPPATRDSHRAATHGAPIAAATQPKSTKRSPREASEGSSGARGTGKASPEEATRAPEDQGRVTPSAAELAFQEGFSALRSGAYGRAAAAFEKVPAASALGEDAAYWHAVALVRDGQRSAGASALARFLKKFPKSSRWGSASVALGWVRLDQGDLEQARQHFEAAEHAPDSQVRGSAQEGLRAIDERSQQ